MHWLQALALGILLQDPQMPIPPSNTSPAAPVEPLPEVEESVVVTSDPDGVHVTIRASSRAATWYTRLAGPATRTAQQLAARRYARALQTLSTP